MNGTLKNETRMLIAFLAGLILTSLGAFSCTGCRDGTYFWQYPASS